MAHMTFLGYMKRRSDGWYYITVPKKVIRTIIPPKPNAVLSIRISDEEKDISQGEQTR